MMGREIKQERKRKRERERGRERAEQLAINHKTERQTYRNVERQKDRNNIYKNRTIKNEWKYGWLARGWNGRANDKRDCDEIEKDRSNARDI